MAEEVSSLMTDFAKIPDKLSVDAGQYLCTVIGVEPKKSANAAGTVMFAPQLEISHELDRKTGSLKETNVAGANLFDSFLPFQIDATSKMSSYMKSQALTRAKRFLMACGFVPDMSAMIASKPTPDQVVHILKTQFAPQLLQKKIVVKVSVDASGQNRINDYDPYQQAGTAPAAAAAAPATA